MSVGLETRTRKNRQLLPRQGSKMVIIITTLTVYLWEGYKVEKSVKKYTPPEVKQNRK